MKRSADWTLSAENRFRYSQGGGRHTLAAGRIAGAYRLLGNARTADEIVSTMDRAGHKVREDENPFKAPVPMQLGGARPVSPIVTRDRLMRAEIRGDVIEAFEIETCYS